MAGESPGREQQQDTSGEVAGHPVADPRLAVFRAPVETREARVTGDVRGGRAGASGGSVPAHAPGPAPTPEPAARPHPTSASALAPPPNTPIGGLPVDTPSVPVTPSVPPVSRASAAPAEKPESNRDLDPVTDDVPEVDEASVANVISPLSEEEDAARAEAEDDRGSDDADDGGTTPGSVEDERPDAAEVRTAEARTTEVADEADAAPAGGGGTMELVVGGRPGAGEPAAGGEGEAAEGRESSEGDDSVDGLGDAPADEPGDDAVEDAAPSPADGWQWFSGRTAAGASGAGSEGESGSAEDAQPERTSAEDADDAEPVADAKVAEPAKAPKDARDTKAPKDADAPKDVRAPKAPEAPKDAKDPEAPEDPAEDARPAKEPLPDVPPAVSRSVLRPLVSDLPGERLTALGTPSAASVPPGTAGRAAGTTSGRTSPVAPSLKPSARPAGKEATTPKPAGGTAVPLPPAAVVGEALGPAGTRTMPVPPEPGTETPQEPGPLKLLAELTNTPPPRQTALRSVARRFKIWTPLVLLLAVVFVVVQAVRPLPAPQMRLTSAASYTFDGTPLPASLPWPTQGQSAVEVEGLGSLGVHGAQTPVPIASVTKVMTAYQILKDHPLTGKATGPLITVDAQAANEAASTDESTAKVQEGQQFTERQMLQLLLIPSGNNIARLLARWDSRTQPAFVAKMTKTAAALGMTQTTYTGASGFESSTKSTAADQLKLAREVMKNEVFRSVVAMPNIVIPGVGKIYNNNGDLQYAGVVGIKTGSSTPAGGALMWAAHKRVDGKEQTILGVVLQQRGGTTVYDSLQVALDKAQSLINGVQNGLTSLTIVKKGEVVGRIDDGLGGTTPVVAAKDLTAIGWPGRKAAVTLGPTSAGIPHSAKAGTPVGTIGFGTGSARTSVPVLLQSALHEPPFGKKLIRTA